jgi:hypothetical protein
LEILGIQIGGSWEKSKVDDVFWSQPSTTSNQEKKHVWMPHQVFVWDAIMNNQGDCLIKTN